MKSMGAQSQTQQVQQIDKRAILAVILALKEKENFVLKYSDIEDALRKLIEDEDEYYKVSHIHSPQLCLVHRCLRISMYCTSL